MRIKLLTVIIVLTVVQMMVADSAVLASDGAELFVRLTCYTCHGKEGRGMFRAETKARYRLKKKVFKKLKKAGVPADIIAKLKPLNKKKFTEEDKFVEAIKNLLGKKDTQRYIETIIKSAGRIYYRKGDRVAGFEGYPKLAGNKKIYLFKQMTDILEGRRTNGNTDAMRGIQPFLQTNKITHKELKLIAEYLSKIR